MASESNLSIQKHSPTVTLQFLKQQYAHQGVWHAKYQVPPNEISYINFRRT